MHLHHAFLIASIDSYIVFLTFLCCLIGSNDANIIKILSFLFAFLLWHECFTNFLIKYINLMHSYILNNSKLLRFVTFFTAVWTSTISGTLPELNTLSTFQSLDFISILIIIKYTLVFVIKKIKWRFEGVILIFFNSSFFQSFTAEKSFIFENQNGHWNY